MFDARPCNALGVGLRLLNVRAVSVADMLPALIVAPLLTVGVQALGLVG